VGFDSDFATAWQWLGGGQGEAITYTPAGGSPKTIQAVVMRETRRQLPTNSSTTTREQIEVVIRTDATLGVASPTAYPGGDSCTVDGTTWYVIIVLERSVAGEHRLGLSTKLLEWERRSQQG